MHGPTVCSLDDIEEVITVSFELNNYGVIEGQSSVEVCAVASATPSPGQMVLARVSTQDGTATG